MILKVKSYIKYGEYDVSNFDSNKISEIEGKNIIELINKIPIHIYQTNKDTQNIMTSLKDILVSRTLVYEKKDNIKFYNDILTQKIKFTSKEFDKLEKELNKIFGNLIETESQNVENVLNFLKKIPENNSIDLLTILGPTFIVFMFYNFVKSKNKRK
jgi:hypothetical protein